MNIIVEGVDGIGKSTLVAALSKELNYAIVHNKANTDNSFTYYEKLMSVPYLIEDRGFISEIIYREVFEREYILGKEESELLFFFAKERIKIIILYSSDQTFYMRNNKNEDPELQENQVKINNLYRSIPLQEYIFKFDMAKYQDNYDGLLEDVLEAIK